MTDIVERLRDKVPMIWGDEGFMITDDDTVLATFKEAADEIERLREVLREIIKLDDEWKPETLDDYSGTAYEHCGNIARCALGEEE